MDRNRFPTALVANRDEFLRIALGAILSQHLGIAEVMHARSLDEATRRLRNTPGISLALFDVSTEGLKSVADLEIVCQHFPNTRVVVVGGSGQRDDVLTALRAGVQGYLTRGLGAFDTTEALRSMLSGTVYVPPSLARVPPGRSLPPRQPGTPARAGMVPSLTPRQREVLELIIQGKSNKEIARSLNLGEGTVKVHLGALFRSLGVSNRAGAAVAGARLLSAASPAWSEAE